MNTNAFSHLNYTSPESLQLPLFSLLDAQVVLVQVLHEFGSCFQRLGVIFLNTQYQTKSTKL